MSTLKPSHIAHFSKKHAICDGFSVSTALFSIIFYSVRIATAYIYTDPLASGQRKRLLGSGEEVETTLSKLPKNDATVQGMMRQQNKHDY